MKIHKEAIEDLERLNSGLKARLTGAGHRVYARTRLSDELDLLQEAATKDALNSLRTDVAILRMAGSQLVVEGQETFSQILRNGGTIRVLLLLPASEGFRTRVARVQPGSDQRLHAERLSALLNWQRFSAWSGGRPPRAYRFVSMEPSLTAMCF